MALLLVSQATYSIEAVDASSPHTYVESTIDIAKYEARGSKIHPELIVSVSALETGWGKSVKGNNYFGIKGKGQVIVTHEVINGSRVRVKASFRTYESFRESTQDFILLMEKPRYKAVREANGILDQAFELQRAGYATDPKYAIKILSIYFLYVL